MDALFQVPENGKMSTVAILFILPFWALSMAGLYCVLCGKSFHVVMALLAVATLWVLL